MTDRAWLLTWTTYGTWLPGDARGFVGTYRDCQTQQRVIHNTFGTPYARDLPGLRRYAQERMLGEPIWFTASHAAIVWEAFQQTADYRGWRLRAVAIMANHLHLVVLAAEDWSPARLMQVLKSYASRALNQRWGMPAAGRWWTRSGSHRRLPNARAVRSAAAYVRQQHRPLLVWVADDGW